MEQRTIVFIWLLIACHYFLVLVSALQNAPRLNEIANGRDTPATRLPQTLLFREPTTGVPVHLVGTMHYNPHSVSRVTSVITKYGNQNQLGSLVVESCPTRWKAMRQKHPAKPLLRRILDSEFQASAEAAANYLDGQVVLADEDIDANDRKVREVFMSSLRDYLDPLGGGWTRIAEDLLQGYGESIDPTFGSNSDTKHNKNNEYLEWQDVFDPELMVGTPLSLIRYMISAVVRKPLKGTLLLVWIGALTTLLVTRVGFSDGGVAIGLSSLYGFLLSLSLGIPLLGRVFLFALLGERNAILAGNIRSECRNMVARANNNDSTSNSSSSISNSDKSSMSNNESRNDKVCVVVVGLAHCNGVKRELMCSKSDWQSVQQSDSN